MDALIWILLSTFLVSLIAFVGVLALFLKEELLSKILLVLVSLSAGALLGGAFLHLIPEAIETAGESLNVFLYVLLGFSLFFVLEQFIHWHHCHKTPSKHTIKPVSYLILFADGVHNFIDGLIIGGSFLMSVHVGIVTTLAVALHEIPQEIGDFGVLVHSGFEKIKALKMNFISGLTAILGGLTAYFLAGFVGGSIVFLLPFAAGNFIYIASSDLVPEIKHNRDLKKNLTNFLVFLVGILLMLGMKLLAH